MKISLRHYLVGLIGCGLTLILSFLGLLLLLVSPNFSGVVFQYFTVLSNVFVFLTSLLGVILYLISYIKAQDYVKEVFQVIRLVSVVCVAITFTMVVIFLAPADKSFPWFGDYYLFLHAVVPIMAVVSYMFLEYAPKMKFRYFFAPVIAIFLYGIFYVLFAFFAEPGTQIDWYGFLLEPAHRIAPASGSYISWANLFIFLGESLGGALAFGLIFWLVNKIMHLVFAGYNIVGEEGKLDTPIRIARAEDLDEEQTKKSSNSQTNKSYYYNNKPRVYHISRSKFVSKHWQVKLATGEKAIKTFDTQAEAISYAKELAKRNGGSIRIHSVRGQIRK